MATISVSDSTVTSESLAVNNYFISVVDGTLPSEGRINWFTNPSFEAASGGWGISQVGTVTGMTATLQDSTNVLYRSNAAKVQSGGVNNEYYLNSGLINVIPGVTYTYSIYYFIPNGSPITTMGMHLVNSANTSFITGNDGMAITQGQWTRLSLTYTVPAGTTQVIARAGRAGGSSLSTGNIGTWWADGALFEANTIAQTYFDGSTNSGYWQGAADNSISQQYSFNVNQPVISVSEYTQTTEPNSNVIYNGTFENAPATNTPQTTSGGASDWIDGTSTGSTNNTYGWFSSSLTSGATVYFDNTQSHTGNYSLHLSPNGGGTQIQINNWQAIPSANWPYQVVGGQTYSYSVWVKTNVNSGSATTGFAINFVERNNSATITATTTTTNITTTTGWTQYTGTFVTNANSTYLTVKLFYTNSGGSANLNMDVWVDDIQVWPVAFPSVSYTSSVSDTIYHYDLPNPALIFDGVQTYAGLTVPASGGVNLTSFSTWSFIATVYPFAATPQNQGILYLGFNYAGATGVGFDLSITGTLEVYGMKASTVQASASAITWNTVSYVGATYDGTTLRLYVNGSLDANTFTGLNNSAATTTTGNVGAEANTPNNGSAGGRHFYGGIMDIQCFGGRVLTGTDMTNYANGTMPTTTNQVLWYQFNTGNGSTLYDVSSSATNATLQGTPTPSWNTFSVQELVGIAVQPGPLYTINGVKIV